jgi:hypothetical protein
MLTGCPDPGGTTTKNSEASVTAIKIAGVVVGTVPAAVPGTVFTGEDFAVNQLDQATQVGAVVLAQASDLANAVINVTASSGATVKYAAALNVNDLAFLDSNTVTLTNLGYLFIQVTAEDGGAVNYYVVRITTLNTVTSLTSVTVAGKEATLAAQGTEPAEAATGLVGLSNTEKTNAAVVVTKFNSNQNVKLAKVTGAGTPSFGTDTTFTFADGDYLYIEVTAENGTNKGVYKVEVQVSRDTTLSVLNIGGTDVGTLGTPDATLANVTAGTVLLTSPGTSHALTITPTDSEATATWAAGASDPAAGAFGTTSSLTFVDGQYLYVKIVAGNGITTAYYKVQVNLQMTATIKYGQPDIQASANHYIDPIWNTVTETYNIVKIYGTDSDDSWELAPDTSGIAKALFDGDGLYVYVVVTDPNVDTTGTSDHLKDSVELFINEAVNGDGDIIKTPVGYADKGGQYRVNAAGGKSGDATIPKASAWTTATGYVVIFQAPWRFKSTTYPLSDGKKIGFELQINACSAGNRDGVVVWNNIAHGNYQNVSDFGEATLDLNSHTLEVNAQNPTITVNPTGKLYQPSDVVADLTVSGTSPDSGSVTYQWYSNTTNSYTGGTALGTEASHTPASTADGVTTYYWADVTNTITDNFDGGNKAATLRSAIASILVSTVPLVERVEAGGSSLPVYRFTLPAGETWSEYATITYTVKVADSATWTQGACRAYIGGSYAESNFDNNGTFQKLSSWNDSRLVKITDGATPDAILGAGSALYTWTTLSYPIVKADIAAGDLDGSYSDATYYPAATATGPFYFSLGLSVNPNNAASATVIYYVKDVALVKADGVTRLPADDLDTAFKGTTLGQLHTIFSNAAGGKVIRTLEPEPVAP